MFIDKANHIYIAMPMYILIEYNDNYSDISGSLWQFTTVYYSLTIANSQSLKYKAALVEKTKDAVNNTNDSVKKKTQK